MVTVCPLVAIHCGHHSWARSQLQWYSNQRLKRLAYRVVAAAAVAAAVGSVVDHSCCTVAAEGPGHASASSAQLERCTPARLGSCLQAATNLIVAVLLRGRSGLAIILVRGLRAGRCLVAVAWLWTFVPVSVRQKLSSELYDLRRSAVVLGRVSLRRGSVAVLGRGSAVAVLVVLLARIAVRHDGRGV